MLASSRWRGWQVLAGAGSGDRVAAVSEAAAEATSAVELDCSLRLPGLGAGVSVAASEAVPAADLPGRVPFVARPVVVPLVVVASVAVSRVVVARVVVALAVVSLMVAEPVGDLSSATSEAVASGLAFDLRPRRGLIVSGASGVPWSALPALLASVPVPDPVPVEAVAAGLGASEPVGAVLAASVPLPVLVGAVPVGAALVARWSPAALVVPEPGAPAPLGVAADLRVVRPPVGLPLVAVLPLVSVAVLPVGSSTARPPVGVAASARPDVVPVAVASVTLLTSVPAEGPVVARTSSGAGASALRR